MLTFSQHAVSSLSCGCPCGVGEVGCAIRKKIPGHLAPRSGGNSKAETLQRCIFRTGRSGTTLLPYEEDTRKTIQFQSHY